MENNNYKVSIILPVYNVAKYLEECFESIKNQSYNNIEIIFVDDGSTDNSGKLLDSFKKKDKRVQVYHKTNGGVSSAKNYGLKKATGDYITFIDPDDYITYEYVEYLLSLAINNNCEVSLSKLFFDNYNMKRNDDDQIKVLTPKNALIEILTYNINVAVWNKMYNKKLIDSKKILFYEDIFMGEGFNFNILTFKNANKIAMGYKKVYFYRRDNNESATTKFKTEKWKNALLAVDRIKLNLNSRDKKINKALKFAEWRTNVDAFTLMLISKQKKMDKEFYVKLRKKGRKYFYIPFLVKCSKKDKIRGITMLLCPTILPNLLLFRRKIKKVEIKN